MKILRKKRNSNKKDDKIDSNNRTIIFFTYLELVGHILIFGWVIGGKLIISAKKKTKKYNFYFTSNNISHS